MKIQNVILFIGLGVITASCGIGKKDGRVVLHSESEEVLRLRGYEVSKIKLGQAIASQMVSVSEVYDINRFSNWWSKDGITFSVKTTSGIVHTGLSCSADYEFIHTRNEDYYSMRYRDCSNDEVKFDKTINIRMPDVLIIRPEGNQAIIH